MSSRIVFSFAFCELFVSFALRIVFSRNYPFALVGKLHESSQCRRDLPQSVPKAMAGTKAMANRAFHHSMAFHHKCGSHKRINGIIAYKIWMRSICCLPQDYISVSISHPKLVSLLGKSKSINFCKNSGRSDVLNSLSMRPFPHTDRAILASGHIWKYERTLPDAKCHSYFEGALHEVKKCRKNLTSCFYWLTNG